MYSTIGGFTLDDTVLPSGEIQWSAPGGNALYSAIGAWLWGADVAIVARVGRDYPQAHLEKLEAAGFDLSGVRRVDHPSFHVWVLHEGHGRRQIVYRLDSGTNEALDPAPGDIPRRCLEGEAAHICPILGISQASLIEYLLAKGVPVTLDLIAISGQIDLERGHRMDLWASLKAFLPSLEEAEILWGKRPLDELILKARAVGTETIAIKLGPRGSIVGGADGSTYHVPAFPADPVDTTGAGDAYCGGFMVGLQETGDIIEAGLRGTVSASFIIEGFGALHALDVPEEKTHERLNQLRGRVRPLDLAEVPLVG